MGNGTLEFDCTSNSSQSGHGICTRTVLDIQQDTLVTNDTSYKPFFWYHRGSSVSFPLQTTAGPLHTGKNYSIQISAWILSPQQSQCPEAGNPYPDNSTGTSTGIIQPTPH